MHGLVHRADGAGELRDHHRYAGLHRLFRRVLEVPVPERGRADARRCDGREAGLLERASRGSVPALGTSGMAELARSWHKASVK